MTEATVETDEDRAVETVEDKVAIKPVVKPFDIQASAAQVRQYLASSLDEDASPKREPPMRTVDDKTGQLKILSSADSLMKWLPKLSWDYLAHWCMMPIFRIRLFGDKATYIERDIAYVEHIFSEGVDLETAVLWWRKRVNQEKKGFAVFEGGFDSSGPLLLTPAPRLTVDAATGDSEADSAEQIEQKWILHNKRQQMSQKWGAKGMSEDMLRKIESAEQIIKEKKRRGQEFMLKGGWVSKKETIKGGLDLGRHNELAKRYG